MIDLSKRGELSSGEYDSAMRIHWKNHGLIGNYGPSPSLVAEEPIEACGAQRDGRAK